MTDNLTPPPMSEEGIDALDKWCIGWMAPLGKRSVREFAASIIAARDEQWRQRLERVGVIEHSSYGVGFAASADFVESKEGTYCLMDVYCIKE